MSLRCIATEDLASMHEYEPGTTKQHDKLFYDGYSICGRKENAPVHRGACPNGCDRPGTGDGEACCKRCDLGMEHHSSKCDQRNAKVTGDA